MKRLLAVLLALMLLTGCATGGRTDLMETITPNTVHIVCDPQAGSRVVADFGVRLLQNSGFSRGNTLISPLSVLSALAMTLNGADGATRQQMERVFGTDGETLNRFFHNCLKTLPEENACSLRLANSLWFRKSPDFTANPIFLQTNADYYGADIFESAFDDTTRDSINAWVRENTQGMIPQIVDKIPEEAVMYLINALAFEGEWEDGYSQNRIVPREFICADGSIQRVEMMYSEEGLYLEDAQAEGFVKFYKGRRCAFVALLPREGVSLEEYVSGLTGAHLLELVENPKEILVEAGIPKFDLEYDLELSDLLKNLGMENAFDPETADFSLLGRSDLGNLYLSRVMHKTFIALDEKGTKAGAATSVEVTRECAIDPESCRTVVLNRPFVYALVDTVTGMPFFLGTMLDPDQKQNQGTLPEDTLKQETTEPEDLYAAEPPILLAWDGATEHPATRFTIYWDHLAENGERIAICADCPHPLQVKDMMKPLHTYQSAVALRFSRQPDSVTIGAWRDSEWDNPDARQEQVEYDGAWMYLKVGGWIYEITATWEPDGDASHGTVQYAVYIVGNGVGNGAGQVELKGYDQAVITLPDGEEYVVDGPDAVRLTGILGSLSYDPKKLCKCLPQFTVTAPDGTAWGLNLGDAYARNGSGQAKLTREQVEQIRTILKSHNYSD